MRTLYIRITMMTMIIMIASTLIAFFVINIYYHYSLKVENDQKITKIAKNIVTVFEQDPTLESSAYLSSMADLGYKFYLVDEHGQGKTYGEPFRLYNLDPSDVEKVFAGNIYHGISEYPWKPFITGFFDNEVRNTIGIQMEIDGEINALFVRPSSTQQFGEMRVFLIALLVLILLLSFLLIIISTRFIVNPIKKLTVATRKIAAGNYHVKLDVKRHDEIGRLADDFSKMNERLEQTEEKRQEFVASVSHEIQSPLTSIQGFSQVLREQDLSKEEQKYYLSIIEKESRRVSLLSKQLLTLSFLDGGIDRKQMHTFNVAEQLREVVSTAEWQWRNKDVMIEMAVFDIMVYGDPKLLHQVWLNLLTNAIRYNLSGGKITIQTIDQLSHVDVVFRDTGIGISEADLPQLFDRFYKVDKARTRTESSTGLGLSIVKKIIEQHNGTIMVESKLQQGSKFIVSLPKVSSLSTENIDD